MASPTLCAENTSVCVVFVFATHVYFVFTKVKSDRISSQILTRAKYGLASVSIHKKRKYVHAYVYMCVLCLGHCAR